MDMPFHLALPTRYSYTKHEIRDRLPPRLPPSLAWAAPLRRIACGASLARLHDEPQTPKPGILVSVRLYMLTNYAY